MILVVVVLLAIALLVCGCQEEQKVWGIGETPTEYQEYFGNGNNARLNHKQNLIIDSQTAILYGVTTKDPNGQQVRKRGLIERITALEDRVSKCMFTCESFESTLAKQDGRLKKIEDTHAQRYDPNRNYEIFVTGVPPELITQWGNQEDKKCAPGCIVVHTPSRTKCVTVDLVGDATEICDVTRED